MRRILVALFVFLGISAYSQTYKINGHIYNASDESEILIGVNIVYGPGKGTVTDIDGNYELELTPGNYSITYSYVGFEPSTKEIIVSDRNQIIDVRLTPLTISEVVVVADVARSRETPVAFTTLTPAKIQENLGAQDIPMLLNSTPGVYATQEGGGDGDAQVTIRGFDSRNVGVLLDGVPVNDMENGHVYWSNWFGLDGVTRSIQVQRGLGASKLALPSVGGTINIITKGLTSKKGGSFKQEIGSDGYLRSTFGYNSGELKNGWGISVAGSYKRGNGWVDMTWTEGYFYYLKIDKKIGNHIISLSGFGAPQSHGQRSYKLPIAVYDSAYAEELGVQLHYTADMSSEDSAIVAINRGNADEGIGRGLRFNQHWGYLTTTENGVTETTALSERVNKYHKPQFTLKDYWTINDKLYMSNIAYLSIGRGGGVSLSSSTGPNEDGLKDFDGIYERNTGDGTISPLYDDELHAASNYLVMKTNEHFWFGLLSTLNYRPSSSLNFSGGIDLRSYKGTHYEQIYDLLGADYEDPDYYDASLVKDWTVPNPLADFMLYEGDINNYKYHGLVRWGGLFLQGEYKYNRISSFINLTSSLTAYKRIDELFFLIDNVDVSAMYENGYHYFPGYTIKGGLNYNITDRMNVFFNTGMLNKAPGLSNTFDYSNNLRSNIKNEKVQAVEFGYSYSSRAFSLNLNAYYTTWDNKPVTKRVQVGNPDEDLTAVITKMDAIHKGVEIDFVYKASSKLEFQGLVSLGDWRWNSKDSVEIIDNRNQVVDMTYFNAVGVHVGNSAQTQFAGEIRYEPIDNLYLKARYTYFDRYFAAFDPGSLFEEAIESWQIPAYGLLDLHAGYRFKILGKHYIQVRGNILNTLNTKYIATAQNNDQYNGIAQNDFDAKSASVFMGLGRRYSLSIQYKF